MGVAANREISLFEIEFPKLTGPNFAKQFRFPDLILDHNWGKEFVFPIRNFNWLHSLLCACPWNTARETPSVEPIEYSWIALGPKNVDSRARNGQVRLLQEVFDFPPRYEGNER